MPDENLPPSTNPTEQQDLLNRIFVSVEKTRKMFLWTLIITIVAFVLPLIGLAFAIPYFIGTYLSAFSSTLGL